MPTDYKRREHYYMQIDLINSAAIEAAGQVTPAPESK
jgi:hypothetical protein